MSCRKVPSFLKDLKRDSLGQGFTTLCKDGVVRTLDGDHKVVDAKGLTPGEIQELWESLPEPVRGEPLHGVDGTKVPRDEWFDPPAGVLPAKLTEKERADELEKMREKMAKDARN